jgi:glycosyltransferase involved in cell wall biosynthesis
VIPNRPDIRAEVCRRQVVVLPFVSGGGIKNKLLEAAAMGMPIVCSSHAWSGLKADSDLPVLLANRPENWLGAIQEFWNDSEKRRTLGARSRQWVIREHTWDAVARNAVAGLQIAAGGEKARQLTARRHV